MEKAKNINATDWQREVLAAEVPVLVDFWADWCAPCRMVCPMVEEIADQKSGELEAFKVDVANLAAMCATHSGTETVA